MQLLNGSTGKRGLNLKKGSCVPGRYNITDLLFSSLPQWTALVLDSPSALATMEEKTH